MYKYLSLVNELEKMIQTNQYEAGAKLPSIRDLSEQYQCSMNTVIKAFQKLERQDMVFAIPQSGYYVVQKKFDVIKKNKNQELNFVSTAPNWSEFPYLDFQHSLNKAIDTYRQELFNYGTPRGLPSLIKVVHKQLATYQIFTNQENIFITSGVQQALAILNALPFPNNKNKILVEQPSYHLFIEHLQVYKIPAIGISRTANGIDLVELEHIFRDEDVKFFYTMPRFHNPLGTSYSQKEKIEIVKLAAKYDVYIVEDDYLADYEENSKVDPLYAYDTNGKVIYLKSYSKIMFPGLRVGVVVLPKDLVEKFQQYKKIADIDSSMISQAALEIDIKSGMFEQHKRKIRSRYLSRAKLLYESLEKYSNENLDIEKIKIPSSLCMHAHIVLHKNINSNQLLRNLKKQGVLIELAKANYLETFQQINILKLNVSSVDESKIEEGVKRIVKEINNASRKKF
ncbi:PLP-dependent aminotransferase family protein [Sporomusa sp. KB1]|jgi:DNA-binding transcriptional MocR family regulator|uniref:aminotransferase-like domain-containing protein n=1 Tax=Sporomusa sp. KB1 TaxID=943346 RepID=UPI0011AAD70F|nr:PLP-dependent aminotransferase family protein [Sporomusa sp. KB1]TWH47303.1 DNA-binding transcriptional MocR family regulator [Sporomusa sp. KB1]